MTSQQLDFLTISRRSTGFNEELQQAIPTPETTIWSNALYEVEVADNLLARLPQHGPELELVVSATAMDIWRAQLNGLTKLEAQVFDAHSKGDLTHYVREVETICRRRGNESRGRRIAKFFRPWFRTVNQYAPVAQTMIQSDPTSAALVLGAITCIMAISERYLDFADKIAETLADMGDKIDILMEYGTEVYRNNDSIQVAIVNIFIDVLTFCRKALPMFRDNNNRDRGSVKTFFKSLETSYELYFGDVLNRYSKDLELFEEKAKLCDRREERESRRLQGEVFRWGIVQALRTREDVESVRQETQSAVASGRDYVRSREYEERLREEKRVRQQEAEEKEMLRQKIRNWISQSTIDFHKDQNKKTYTRITGSGSWLIQHKDYIDWKSSSDKNYTLWVSGRRGFGKSFLTSVVVQDLRTECEHATNFQVPSREKIALAFIYCTSLETDKYDMSKLLSSIVEQLNNQLSDPGIDKQLERLYGGHGGTRPLDTNEIRQALESLLTTFRTTYIIVDGLDELKVLDQKLFEEYCQYFHNLTHLSKADCTVKLLVLSRPEYQVIENIYNKVPRIIIDGHVNNVDIGNFISMKLDTIGFHDRHKPEVLSTVKQRLVSKAEGMFLWLDLVVNSLRNEKTTNGLLGRIEKLPKDLESQYASSLWKIQSKDDEGQLAFKILLWITNARRALTGSELSEILAIRPETTEIDDDDAIRDDTDFCSDCENLITLDRATQTYQLLHSSFQDFLGTAPLTSTKIPQEYCTLQADAQRILAIVCLTYLEFNAFSGGPAASKNALRTMLHKYPFLEYAATYWGRHVAAANDSELNVRARAFVTSFRARDLSMQIILIAEGQQFQSLSRPSTPLHLLAVFDLVDVASTLPDVSRHQTKQDELSRCPIDYALIYKSRKMCNWILSTSNDAELMQIDLACQTLIPHRAAYCNWPEVVQALIDRAFDIQGIAGESGSTILHAAASNGSLDVLRILIKMKMKLDAQDKDGSTPLCIACRANDIKSAKMLVEAGADVTVAEYDGSTSLHFAVTWGNLELVNLLLSNDVNKNAAWSEVIHHQTPLHIAVSAQEDQILQRLIEAQVEIDAADSDKETALHLACDEGYSKGVEILLKAGAMTMVQSVNGSSPLHLAAEKGNARIVSMILQYQAGKCSDLLNLKDKSGDTALHNAVRSGDLVTVQLLIDYGAPSDIPGFNDDLPVHLSTRSENIEIVKYLMGSNPSSVACKGSDGSPILHYVAHYGAKYPALNDLIASILSTGASADAVNGSGEQAIHFAARQGNLDFAINILQQVPGLCLGVLSKRRKTPMYIAAENGHWQFVSWLKTNHSAGEHLVDEDGNSPMQISAWNGHTRVLEGLLTSENKDSRGYRGRTALYGASAKGHLDNVKLLLRQGADLNILDDHGNTPLLVSVAQGHMDVASLLLDQNASCDIANDDGMLPLHNACQRGNAILVSNILNNTSNTSCVNKLGRTPFMIALGSNESEILDLLVEKGLAQWTASDHTQVTCLHILASFGSLARFRRCINNIPLDNRRCADELGRNAVYFAAEYGHLQLLHALLTSEVPLQGPDDREKTPLRVAAQRGYVDSVEYLIAAQRDVVSIDEVSGPEGVTALQLAVMYMRPLVAERLVKAGADPRLRDNFGLNAFDYANTHPSVWKDTVFDNGVPEDDHVNWRAAQLVKIAQNMIQVVLRYSDDPSPFGEYRRADSLNTIAIALCWLRTPESLERAQVCYSELADSATYTHYSRGWICAICRRVDFPGPKFLCLHSPDAVELCESCHQLYESGGEHPRSIPKSIGSLQILETKVKFVQQAIFPYAWLGTHGIVTAWNICIGIDDTLVQIREDLEAWKKSCDSHGHLVDRKLIGESFLDWLQRATNTVNDDNTDADSDTDGAQEGVTIEAPAVSTSDQLSTSIDSLDRELMDFFRMNRPDKELPVFACEGHEYLKIVQVGDLDSELKVHIGQNGRIKRSWFEELHEWFKILSSSVEDCSTDAEHERSLTPGIDVPENSTTDGAVLPDHISGPNFESIAVLGDGDEVTLAIEDIKLEHLTNDDGHMSVSSTSNASAPGTSNRRLLIHTGRIFLQILGELPIVLSKAAPETLYSRRSVRARSSDDPSGLGNPHFRPAGAGDFQVWKRNENSSDNHDLGFTIGSFDIVPGESADGTEQGRWSFDTVWMLLVGLMTFEMAWRISQVIHSGTLDSAPLMELLYKIQQDQKREAEGAKAVEPGLETQPAETQPAEAQPAEAQPAEAQPAEAQPAEAQPAEESELQKPDFKIQPADILQVEQHEAKQSQAEEPEGKSTDQIT